MVIGIDSEMGGLETGFPQGSCLGPLFVLIYITDLPKDVQESVVSMYADGTNISIYLDMYCTLTWDKVIMHRCANIDAWQVI